MPGAAGVATLDPDDEVTTRLAVREGVEDGLAVRRACRPVRSWLSAVGARRLPVLGGIEASATRPTPPLRARPRRSAPAPIISTRPNAPPRSASAAPGSRGPNTPATRPARRSRPRITAASLSRRPSRVDGAPRPSLDSGASASPRSVAVTASSAEPSAASTASRPGFVRSAGRTPAATQGEGSADRKLHRPGRGGADAPGGGLRCRPSDGRRAASGQFDAAGAPDHAAGPARGRAIWKGSHERRPNACR